MKKVFVIFLVLIVGIPVMAREHKNFVLEIGETQSNIAKIMGKPDIITQDYDGVLTWVYSDLKKTPVGGFKQDETLEQQKQTSILTIKFDNTYLVKSYGYMTTYYGETK